MKHVYIVTLSLWKVCVCRGSGRQKRALKPLQPTGLAVNLTTLPQQLGNLGYQTHMVGKWHLGKTCFLSSRHIDETVSPRWCTVKKIWWKKNAMRCRKYDITEKDSLQKRSSHTMGTLSRQTHSMKSDCHHSQAAVYKFGRIRCSQTVKSERGRGVVFIVKT